MSYDDPTCPNCRSPLDAGAARCQRCLALTPADAWPADATRTPRLSFDEDLVFDPRGESEWEAGREPERPRAWLRLLGTLAAIEIDRPLVLGRGPTADVRLPLSTVSRRHAIVLPDGETYRIIDLGSRNGVYVNERPIADEKLEHGDILRISAYELAFTLEEPSVTPPPQG